jgi:hypothetical protein
LIFNWFTCFRRTNITAAVVVLRIKRETKKRSIKMKRRIRIESIRVVHPAKTRSTRVLALGNVLGYAWKHIQKLQKRKFDALKICFGDEASVQNSFSLYQYS